MPTELSRLLKLYKIFFLKICRLSVQIRVTNYLLLPVSIAERSKVSTVYDHLNIGIADSNPARGMDVCLRVSVLCCPVSVEALRRADPRAKESYQNVSMYRSRSPLG
jgi:hypothetical protein